MLLALKLFLVPASILLVTLAGQRWGPAVAGWLGGMPVIAGPILLLLALEYGLPFAAEAAIASVSSLLPFVVFVVLYARLAGRCHWGPCYGLAIAGWGLTAWGVAWLAPDVWWAMMLAIAALSLAPQLIPVQTGSAAHRVGAGELVLRMATGLVLTLLVTSAAGALGTGWSGILTVFPVLASVLSVFSHRSQGAAFVVPLLHGTTRGLLALFAFCATLALTISQGLAKAFLLALAISLLVQLASRGLIRNTQH